MDEILIYLCEFTRFAGWKHVNSTSLCWTSYSWWIPIPPKLLVSIWLNPNCCWVKLWKTMFFGPHPKPSQWLNCGPVFRRILWMCLFLQLLNGKMFNFWTSEVGRPGRFSRISRGQVLQAPEEWWFSTTMTCYSWYFINGGQWFHIRNSFMAMDTEWWSKLLAILRFPAISSKTAGANEILNPAVQVGTLLGMTSVTVRWLWVKVLDEYIGCFQLCYICLIIIQCIICIFTNIYIYIYSDIEQNLQNDKPVWFSSSANSFGHSSFQFHSPLSATAHPT